MYSKHRHTERVWKGFRGLTSLYSSFPIYIRSLSTEQPSCPNCLLRASLNGTNSVAGVTIPRVSENIALVKQDTLGNEPTSPGSQANALSTSLIVTPNI